MTLPTDDYTVHAKPTLPMVEFIALMAMLTSLVALCIDAILPALSIIGDELNSSGSQQNHFLVSIFFVGMAFVDFYTMPRTYRDDQYLAGALGMYLTYINLFIFILRLIIALQGGGRRN